MVIVVEECCIVITWSDVVRTRVGDTIIYTISTDCVIGYESSVYIELAIRYLE